MAETTTEKAVCDKCKAEVREGTTFCYNCGAQVAAPEAAKPLVETPVGDKVEDKADDTPTSEEKLSRAAEQRRKARVSQRKSNEYTWEPTPDSPLVLIIAVLVAAVAFAIVFVTVYWK